ncbi:hypothetical protein C7S14_2496 [Burkholderia cepacia]|nr:hypothetical protein C7S14_2496 [Burkholderia cepacia]
MRAALAVACKLALREPYTPAIESPHLPCVSHMTAETRRERPRRVVHARFE